MSDFEDGKEFGSFVKGKDIISIYFSKFKGKTSLHIRAKYFDENTEEYKPTSKGIALNKEQFNKLLDILTNNKDEINKDISSGAKKYED